MKQDRWSSFTKTSRNIDQEILTNNDESGFINALFAQLLLITLALIQSWQHTWSYIYELNEKLNKILIKSISLRYLI